jgi:ABC-type sugar transport system ATPase subunit
MNFFQGEIRDSGGVRFEERSGAFSLPIGGELAARVAHRAGTSVTAGLRPEHLLLAPESGSALAVRVEVVEPVGNETFVHFSAGEAGGPFVCRTQSSTLPRAGEATTLFADAGRLHLFDPATGSSL